MNKFLKIIFTILIILILIILAILVFLQLYKPKVYATQDQCETETKSSCTFYSCDIPIGQLYQKLCVNGRGSGWYNLQTKSND